MKTTYGWIFLGCLALALGLGLAWQRLQLRPLQAELEVLRDQQEEVGRLRTQHARLVAAQVSEAELERLRSDRAAIARMRQEVAALQAKTEAKSRAVAAANQAPERFDMGTPMPAAEWGNAGGATPRAALETVLWAAAGGEVETFAKRIRFDATARMAAQELWQSLPPAERARHASPEAVMAFLSIKDIPIGTATVTTWSGNANTIQSANVTLAAPGEKHRRAYLVFVRDGDEWKLRATEAAVAKYAAALRGVPVAAVGK